jgi:hypothetical protein
MSLPLTQPPGTDLNAAMSRNPPGMAWIQGTGPEGKTCRECVFWRRVSHHRYDEDHRLKPRGCDQYTTQMRRTREEVIGDDVPAETSACRYFEQHEKPQAAIDPTYELMKARAVRKTVREQKKIAAAHAGAA